MTTEPQSIFLKHATCNDCDRKPTHFIELAIPAMFEGDDDIIMTIGMVMCERHANEASDHVAEFLEVNSVQAAIAMCPRLLNTSAAYTIPHLTTDQRWKDHIRQLGVN